MTTETAKQASDAIKHAEKILRFAQKRLHEAHRKIGETFRVSRQEKGMSLREMAGCMGITPTYLSDLETGKRKWTMERIEQYADHLNKG